MNKNYLKLAVRNLLRNKEYFIINVFGLAVGMACAILVMANIWEQLNFDKFHPGSDRLCRVYIDAKMGGLESKAAVTSSLYAFGLKSMVPEIEQSCRIFRMDREIPVKKPISKILNRNTLLFVDSTFFDVFGFKLLKGDPTTCLNQPKSIVLSRKLAFQFFPSGDALGKIIYVENNKEWKVTGVAEDCPENTHLDYDALVSINSLELLANNWTTNFLYTYFRFKSGVNFKEQANPSFLKLSTLEYKLTNALLSKAGDEFIVKAGEEFGHMIGMNLDTLHKDDNYFVLRLQKIADIHLFSHLKYESSQNANIQTFFILAAIAFLIILIGCINYANLSTARLAGRVREIGIRKMMGSQRGELSRQLLAESITISFISLFFALVIVELSYQEVNTLLGGSGHNIQNLLLTLAPAIFGVTLFTGVIAGIYPAFYIIRFSPATILRQQKQFSAGGKSLRGVLVILQFIFSIVIIFSTSTIYRQLRFVQNKGIGFDKENLIVLENAFELGAKKDDFRKKMLELPQVNTVTFSSAVPGRPFHMNSFQSGNPKKDLLLYVMESDSLFFNTYHIQLSEGSLKPPAIMSDTLGITVNQETVRFLGLQNPIGTVIYLINNNNNNEAKPLIIKGVVENFNTESLHSKIQPLIMLPPFNEKMGFVSLRLNHSADDELINKIKSIWNTFLPDIPFSEFSMDEKLGAFYQEEQTTGQIDIMFSFFAIFIACMGLYSLLALTTIYRTKEIGIRKVMGADSRELILLLTKEIFKLIAIAGMIALPISFLSSYYWLERFAYHVSISLTNYIIVFIAVFIVAVFTMYRQLRRTINADPSESLRYE